MLDLHISDCLSPSSIDRLARADGLTPEQAFDALAELAAGPELQAEIVRLQSTTVGRDLLAQQERAWDAEGLPCPWECWLDLTPVT